MSYTKKIGRHYGNLMEKLNIQRCIGEFCDLTVIIHKERFNAHKCVLAAASKKLHNLVGRMTQTDNSTLYIDSVSRQGFKIVLEYIYTSSLWIPTECLTEVSNAATFLEMEELVQSCLAFASQNTSTPNKDNTSDNHVSAHDRDFSQNTDQMAADLMSSKLPELDSSLGGFLDVQQHTPASASGSNYGDTQVDSSKQEEREHYGTYPDQDALSEISVQNDPPGDEGLVYQDIANVQTSSNTDYTYHHYVPPIDQTFSPGRLPKMIHASMTLIPSMLPSHSFLQDTNQYQMDGYYLSQTPQYYSNMNLVNSFIQDQSRGNYSSNTDQSYGPNPSQGFSNVDEVEKQRPYSTYGSNSETSSATYNQMSVGYNDLSYNQEPYENEGKVMRTYSKDFSDDLQPGYKAPSVPNSRNIESDFLPGSSYAPIQHFENPIVESPDNIHTEIYDKTTGLDEATELHKSLSGSISSHEKDNEKHKDTTEDAMDRVITKENDSVRYTDTNKESMNNPKDLHDAEKNTVTSSETQVTGSSYNFSSRPAARMPPKKAGYRGIESDYNREFNTGVKSNIVGQYDNLAAIANPQASPSKDAPNNSSHTEGKDALNLRTSQREDVNMVKSHSHSTINVPPEISYDVTNETHVDTASIHSNTHQQNADATTAGHKAANEFYLTQSTDHSFFSDEVNESLKRSFERRKKSYELPDIRKYTPQTEGQGASQMHQTITDLPYSGGEQTNPPSRSFQREERAQNSQGHFNDTQNTQIPYNGSMRVCCVDIQNEQIQFNTSQNMQTHSNSDATQNVRIQYDISHNQPAHYDASQNPSTEFDSSQNTNQYDATQAHFNISQNPEAQFTVTQNSQTQQKSEKSSNIQLFTPGGGKHMDSIAIGETYKESDHQAPLLSPISTQSMDMGEYGADRDITLNYNQFSNNQDINSQLPNFPKGLNLTPSKHSKADAVYSYLEDYFRLLELQHGQSPTKMPGMSSNSVNYAPQPLYSANTTATYTPVTSSLYVNTQNTGAETAPVYVNISPTPITPSQTYTNSSSNPPHNAANFTSSVEDARKTVLNVLSQEKFDDIVAQNITASAESEAQGEREGVSLSQLYNIEPFDKAGETVVQSYCHNQKEALGNEQQSDDRDQGSKFVPQFEDIDSDSGSESNYKLVIDFDNTVNADDEKRSDKTTQVALSKKANQRPKAASRKQSVKGGKGTNKDSQASEKQRHLQVPSCDDITVSNKSSNVIPQPCMESSSEQKSSFQNETESKPLGSKRRKNQQPIRVPRYSITTEYKESTDNRSGAKPDEIIKPLKKRIKLTLNMAKLQDDDVTVTRAKVKPKVHNRRIKYSCELCKREFWDKYKAFAEHMAAHSRNELNFCNICGMGYKRVEDLSRHRTSAHALNSFECSHCSMCFTNPTLFRKHCLDVHNDTKMFRCLYDNCSFSTGRLNVLEKHTLIHGIEKQLKCPHCARKFAQPNGVRLHLATCLNMQQHVCAQCGKSFNRIQSLREHEAIHKGDKKYVCTVCKSSFTDHRNFKRHSRIHTNEMPYQCKHCGDKFRYSNVLKRHLVSKHQDSVEVGKKGCKNKDSVHIKNYTAQAEVLCN